MDGNAFDEEDLRPFRPQQATPADDLQYKEGCEGCGQHLSWIDAVYVCSHECTWCPECARSFAMVCPSCAGELRRRPRRTQKIG